MLKQSLVLAVSVAVTLAAPLAASARDRDDGGHWDRDEHRIVGRVVESAPYNLQLDHGPHIFLHRGTVIRPRGLELRDGMPVSVIGHRSESGFAADEVDLLRHADGSRDFDRDRGQDRDHEHDHR